MFCYALREHRCNWFLHRKNSTLVYSWLNVSTSSLLLLFASSYNHPGSLSAKCRDKHGAEGETHLKFSHHFLHDVIILITVWSLWKVMVMGIIYSTLKSMEAPNCYELWEGIYPMRWCSICWSRHNESLELSLCHYFLVRWSSYMLFGNWVSGKVVKVYLFLQLLLIIYKKELIVDFRKKRGKDTHLCTSAKAEVEWMNNFRFLEISITENL